METKSIMPFSFDGSDIRVIYNNGEPWFVAKDVCTTLGFGRPNEAVRYLDEDEKGVLPDLTQGGTQELRTINESGLYSLILRSRKPEAKKFKKWVTGTVLPSLRKKGRFEIPGYIAHTPELALLESAASSLRLNDASIICMYHDFGKQHGMNTNFLPAYTDEPETDSLTNLLEQHGCKMSARVVNQVLIEMGCLEEKQRSRSGGKPKRFKCLTEKGLKYGANRKATGSVHETQPIYFVERFGELLGQVKDWVTNS